MRGLHCTALHCTALSCVAQHCTALNWAVLHCTALHYTALHCTALHFCIRSIRVHHTETWLFQANPRIRYSTSCSLYSTVCLALYTLFTLYTLHGTHCTHYTQCTHCTHYTHCTHWTFNHRLIQICRFGSSIWAAPGPRKHDFRIQCCCISTIYIYICIFSRKVNGKLNHSLCYIFLLLQCSV